MRHAILALLLVLLLLNGAWYYSSLAAISQATMQVHPNQPRVGGVGFSQYAYPQTPVEAQLAYLQAQRQLASTRFWGIAVVLVVALGVAFIYLSRAAQQTG